MARKQIWRQMMHCSFDAIELFFFFCFVLTSIVASLMVFFQCFPVFSLLVEFIFANLFNGFILICPTQFNSSFSSFFFYKFPLLKASPDLSITNHKYKLE